MEHEKEQDGYDSHGAFLGSKGCTRIFCPFFGSSYKQHRIQCQDNPDVHSQSIRMQERFEGLGYAGEDLRRKAEAVRGRRCDVRGCFGNGTVFLTAAAAFKHFHTDRHQCLERNPVHEATGDERTGPWQCDLLECPEYGRVFTKRMYLEKHNLGGPHQEGLVRAGARPQEAQVSKAWKQYGWRLTV